MSARERLQAALVAALEGHAALAVTAVFDAPPQRAARPYALVDELLLSDWSTKDLAGREGRFAVLLFDRGERPARLRGLVGEAETAIEGLASDLGGGWRIAGLALARSRLVNEGEGRWMAMSEWRVRMLRES